MRGRSSGGGALRASLFPEGTNGLRDMWDERSAVCLTSRRNGRDTTFVGEVTWLSITRGTTDWQFPGARDFSNFTCEVDHRAPLGRMTKVFRPNSDS
jgi:hypothetical protein